MTSPSPNWFDHADKSTSTDLCQVYSATYNTGEILMFATSLTEANRSAPTKES
jgi:hypothetical protein